MLSLFNTSADEGGFRLQYLEVYNWGTFHEQIFRINPQGNNSLLTGANASGKSTYVDALLTLMVPVKKDRFYNQSSGVDKKGDRTEETYVMGHYGNIQEEGKMSTSALMLRDKNCYSVILANFANDQGKHVTLFQVRWFSNGDLRRAFGIAHIPMEIATDFSTFDGRGNWKKRLDKTYNKNGPKRNVEFMDGPTAYGERIARLFGMRSTKALSLFNQVVGVKVLDNLNHFIRTNMLENQDAETEFIQLKESFLTLMDAKTNIEKAKEQIKQLTPINELAVQLNTIQTEMNQTLSSKETGVYWFANKKVELAEVELLKIKEKLTVLKEELQTLRTKEERLKQEERNLSIAIERDEVGSQIKELEKDIRRLEEKRNARQRKLNDYNKIASKIELPTDPGKDTFEESREKAKTEKGVLEKERSEKDETLRLAKNKRDELNIKIEEGVATIKSLQKNKNNISGRVAEIREMILKEVGATKEEIPFIGELMKVKAEEEDWESALEKVLHNFALRLIVPEKYYKAVNKYVNRTNLKGRIIYQRFRGFTPIGNMMPADNRANNLINKLTFKPRNIYTDWLEDSIFKQYNYNCVDSLDEFNLYDKKAITKRGLIKFGRGKHEKDDRAHVSRKENYVLGWDNKEKISLLKKEIYTLQKEEKKTVQEVRAIERSIREIEDQKEHFSDLFKSFTKYDDIDWKIYANDIQTKETQKAALEKTNNRVKELQSQLAEINKELKQVSNVDLDNTNKAIYKQEGLQDQINSEKEESKGLLKLTGVVDVTDFEKLNPDLLQVEYASLKNTQFDFQRQNTKKINTLERQRIKREDRAKIKINAFKHPTEDITFKFKDWRSDVSRLPESTHLEFISEYQGLLKQLQEDNLPKFEKKFNEYLQETITNKVGDFRMFFENWADSIKENIRLLNEALKEIDFRDKDFKTYIQIVAPIRLNDEVKEFRKLLNNAIPNIRQLDATIDGRKIHFIKNIEPLIKRLDVEQWRKKVMEVRSWFTYKAEEFYKETEQKFKTYENMGQLSGGEKAQLTYTILGSAIAYQFGLTKEGLQSNSFRFIAIDEAFKAQDEDKARYLVTLCKQLHLQLLVVTPSDNIHIVENDISFVHFVERKEEKYSWLYDMPIEQFKEEQIKNNNF